jgi:hypothetical protein
MQFESKIKRRFLVNLLLSFVPDTLISIVIALVFDGGLLGFLFAIAGLYLLYFAIWLKKSIWSWLIYTLSGRKQYASAVLDSLSARNFPEPNEYQDTIDTYFDNVASDESQPINVRLAATAELGTLAYLKAQGHYQESLKLTLAYEDGLAAFKHSFSKVAR